MRDRRFQLGALWSRSSGNKALAGSQWNPRPVAGTPNRLPLWADSME